MSPAAETRAQALLGTRSTKRFEAHTRRALEKASRLLEGLSFKWGEVDSVMSEELDALQATIATMLDPGGVLEECIAQLHEPWGLE